MIDPDNLPPPNAIPYPGGSSAERPQFEPRYGEAVAEEAGVIRVTANNPSHFTFMGTNTFLLEGDGDQLVIVDPGPDQDDHIQTLVRAIGGRPVAAILITHTHVDHSCGLDGLRRHCDAPTYAQGPHRLARELYPGEANRMKGAGDWSFSPDHRLSDGERLTIAGLTIEAIATPGHAANHMSFALPRTGAVIIGDHVMAHSSSIVGPPEGAMAHYLSSLDRLAQRSDRIYYPGHGGAVRNPKERIEELRAHRAKREAALLAGLSSTPKSIAGLVDTIYADIPRSMHTAASLSLQAQLEFLVGCGRAEMVGTVPASARFRLTT